MQAPEYYPAPELAGIVLDSSGQQLVISAMYALKRGTASKIVLDITGQASRAETLGRLWGAPEYCAVEMATFW